MSPYFRMIVFIWYMEQDLWNSKFFIIKFFLIIHPFWVSNSYFTLIWYPYINFNLNFCNSIFYVGEKNTLSVIFQWKSAKAVHLTACCLTKLCSVLVRECMLESQNSIQVFSLSRGNKSFEQSWFCFSSFLWVVLQEKIDILFK